MKILISSFIIFISSMCFAVEKKELRLLLTKAQKVKNLKEPTKQQSALNIIKESFKIVRSNRKNIPGNQAPSIEAKLRKIYQDVKKKDYNSFDKGVQEGESTFKVYDSAEDLLNLLK